MGQPIQKEQINPTAPQRIEYIDVAKGICIFLVVLSHCNIPQTNFLVMLRMPLYFTLSGLFFKDYGGILPMFIKKCNKILIPFIFFYTIGYVILLVKVWMGSRTELSYVAFFVSKDYLSVNGVLWFLLALFWANMIFMLIHRISSNLVFLGTISLLLFAISLRFFNEDFYLPAYIDSALTAMPFFFFGYCLRNTDILIPNKYDRYNYFAVPVLFAVAIVCYLIGDSPRVTISCNGVSGSVPLFMLGSAALVLGTLLLCKAIRTIPYIRYIGRYSLIILGTHILIIETVAYSLLYCGADIYSMPANIIVFIVTLTICTVLIKPLITHFPQFTAQKDLIAFRNKTLEKRNKSKNIC